MMMTMTMIVGGGVAGGGSADGRRWRKEEEEEEVGNYNFQISSLFLSDEVFAHCLRNNRHGYVKHQRIKQFCVRVPLFAVITIQVVDEAHELKF